MVRKSQKTQKKSKKAPVLTIPELRKSLDYISAYGQELVHSTSKSSKELAKDFSQQWKKIFGKSLSLKVAEDYLARMKMVKQEKKGTRRKHKGGAMLTGAPIDHLTRPGVDLPYGNFLPYVSKGFWNPEQAPASQYETFKTVLPYAGTGSDKMNGGGLFDSIGNAVSAYTMRPFVAQNPVPVLNDAMSGWKGQQLGPGPESWQQTWKPQMSSSSTAVPIVQTYTRDLGQDIRTGK